MRRLATIWFILVSLLSLAPLNLKTALGTTGSFHEIGHFFAFAVCGTMALADAPTPVARVRRAAFVILFGGILEGMEALIYRNSFEWIDLMIDCFGVGIAPVLLFVIQSERQK